MWPIMRTVSAGDHVDVCSPRPDTASSIGEGSICRSVARLERSAEELSQGGSDIGEEIRKLHDELRQAPAHTPPFASRDNSRRRTSSYSFASNSLSQSSHSSGPYTRNRGASASSYSNNILHLNREARWGGYSPAAFIGSPAHSSQSGILSRTVSSIMSPTEPTQQDRPLDSPLTSPPALVPETSKTPYYDASDEPGSVIQQNHQWSGKPAAVKPVAEEKEPEMTEAEPQSLQECKSTAKVRGTPSSSISSQKADLLFRDFDGVHFSPITEEFVATDADGHTVGRVPLADADEALKQQRPSTGSPPRYSVLSFQPPTEDMVYYPAPVPRILNLPKRLSARPSSQVIPKRQSRMQRNSSRDNSRNTLVIPPMDFEQLLEAESAAEHDVEIHSGEATPAPAAFQHRSSMIDLNRLSRLPPQLRASIFFDSPADRQSFNVESGSATETLDRILKASASAPVTAFTAHPIAGEAGGDVYARERPAKRSTLSQPLAAEARGSHIPDGYDVELDELKGSKMARRSSIVSMLTDLGKPDSKKLQMESSRHSLHSQDILQEQLPPGPESPAESAFLHRDMRPDTGDPYGDDEYIDDTDMGPVSALPTTLLAELQLRKEQQKSRNRTAATAFPNGMHATLLELDAVAQIESRKRKTQKVALAWEDPIAQIPVDDDANEDVPLAVLFPSAGDTANARAGEGEWDRPFGLIERRQLEDNEPLSQRRNRLLGINRQPTLQEPSFVEHDPDEDLPLAERRRKMQQKAALDGALGEVSRESKSTFGVEVMSGLGMQAEKSGNDDEAGETLGQRRSRLQREKSELSEQSPTTARPALRQRASLANVLSTVPVAPGSGDIKPRAISAYGPTSLLAKQDAISTQQKARVREHNSRHSSYQDPRATLPRSTSMAFPEPGPGDLDSSGQVTGLIAAAGSGAAGRRASSHFGNLLAPAAFTPDLNALALQHKIQAGYAQQDQMLNPLTFQNFVPPAPNTGLGFSGGMAAAPMSMGVTGSQNGLLSHGPQSPLLAYGNGMIGVSPLHIACGAHGGGLDQTRRATIDRWRSSVAQ